jgi:hypothetical protein
VMPGTHVRMVAQALLVATLKSFGLAVDGPEPSLKRLHGPSVDITTDGERGPGGSIRLTVGKK